MTNIETLVFDHLSAAYDRNPDAFRAIHTTFRINVPGAGAWLLDLTAKPVVRPAEPDDEPECDITVNDGDLRALFEQPYEAAHMLADGRASVSSRARAAQLAEALWPGTLRTALSPQLADALLGEQQPVRVGASNAEDFFERALPERLAAEPDAFGAVHAAVSVEVEGAGTWTIQMTRPARVERGAAARARSVIRLSAGDFGRILEDPAAAWPMFNDGRVTATNACRAAQFVRGAFPGAFQRALPPSLYRSLFPQDFYSPSFTEYGGSRDVRTTYVRLATGITPINYSIVGTRAIYQGDIVLYEVEEAEKIAQLASAGVETHEEFHLRGVRIIDWSNPSRYVWPNGVVPYETTITEKPQRVSDAINEWTAKTRITFVARTNQADYVRIIPGSADECHSQVGRRGGMQEIVIGKNCGTGSVIHEIGHMVGLWHEQSRIDRDNHVKIIWGNIEAGREHNFDKKSASNAEDLGSYDFGSIMHYGADAFSKNGKATIETIPSGKSIGQRDGLSAGDVAAVASIYGPKL